MSGVTDFLFGSSPDSSTQAAPTLAPGQADLLTQIIDIIKNQTGKPVSSYPKTSSPLQQSSYDWANNLLQGGGIYGQGSDELSKELQPWNDKGAKDYWTQAIKAPMEQQYLETVPKVLEPYIAANAQDSGAARRALARLGVDLETNLSSTLAQTLYNDKQSYQNTKSGALNQILGYSTLPYTVSSQAGQTQYNQDLYKWLQEQTYNNPWLQQYLFPSLGVKTKDTVVTNTPGTAGFINTAVGSPAAGAAAAALFSDRRLKKDIEYLN